MAILKNAAAAAIAALLVVAWPAIAAQDELVPPTSGVFTGVEFSQRLGDAFRSLASGNKGSTAPANVGGDAVDGLPWIDDSVTPWLKKRYINGGWAVEGAYDPTDSSYVGIIGGGIATLASGSTVDLGSVPQANVNITGTTGITGFGSSAPIGIEKTIRFDGALVLTHSSSLLVPGGYSLTTAASDRAKVTHLGSGVWEITTYTRASGTPIDVSAVGKIEFGMFESVPENHVAGYGQALTRTSYPVLVAKLTRAQNGTRTSGNATIASVGNTVGLGAGMPVEGTGINAGCTIASVVLNTSITLNSSGCVTASGTSTVTVFLTGYGTSGSSSTIGAPDCKGRVLAGRDQIGLLANRLTSTYFGGNSAIFNVAGGLEWHDLVAAEIPPITSVNASQAISVTSAFTYARDPAGFNTMGTSGAGFGTLWASTVPIAAITSTGSNSISVTSSNTGGDPHAIVQPTLIAECVVRVTP